LIDFGFVTVAPWETSFVIAQIKQQIMLPKTTNTDVVLPTSVRVDQTNIPLTWQSSLPAVLSNEGQVFALVNDTSVLLSVLAVVNNTTISFEYGSLTVLALSAEERIAKAKAQISLPSETKTDLILPKNIDGVAINWFSSHPKIFTNKGEWTYQETDTTVALTAVFSYGGLYEEETYLLDILTYTDEERLSKAYDQLSLPSTAEQNLELPIALAYGVTATWLSSHPHIISNAGIVNLNEKENTVTLTATLKSGAKTMEKEFEITTKAISPSEVHFNGHMYTHRINDFILDGTNGLTINNKQVVLTDTSTAGTYESKIINTSPFTILVGSWSAISSTDATVELKVRVRVNGVWSSYLSYSAWGFGRQNAMLNQDGGVASMNADEIMIKNNAQANAFQFQVTLRRNNVTTASPRLWLVGIALTIPNYSFPVDVSGLPNFVDYDVPKLYQHDVPTIGNSICSIASSTMLLLYHGHTFTNPLPHQETAALFRDYGNKIYGNWVFNTVGMSSYGETSYVKKIYSWDELRYHLVHVGPVALSIKGDTGVYKTNGHLIVVRGYEIIGSETYVITNDPNIKGVYYKFPLATFLNFTRNVIYVVE